VNFTAAANAIRAPGGARTGFPDFIQSRPGHLQAREVLQDKDESKLAQMARPTPLGPA
jgi:hypothetical protein